EGPLGVVGPRGQVDDRVTRSVDRGEEIVEAPDPDRYATRRGHGIGESRGPDQVVGQDDDPRQRDLGGAIALPGDLGPLERRRGIRSHGRSPARAQDNPAARCLKTSRAETTPIGVAPSMIGTWRNPPTAILWMATATGSSRRSTTGSGVMTSRTGRGSSTPGPTFRTASRS